MSFNLNKLVVGLGSDSGDEEQIDSQNTFITLDRIQNGFRLASSISLLAKSKVDPEQVAFKHKDKVLSFEMDETTSTTDLMSEHPAELADQEGASLPPSQSDTGSQGDIDGDGADFDGEGSFIPDLLTGDQDETQGPPVQDDGYPFFTWNDVLIEVATLEKLVRSRGNDVSDYPEIFEHPEKFLLNLTKRDDPPPIATLLLDLILQLPSDFMHLLGFLIELDGANRLYQVRRTHSGELLDSQKRVIIEPAELVNKIVVHNEQAEDLNFMVGDVILTDGTRVSFDEYYGLLHHHDKPDDVEDPEDQTPDLSRSFVSYSESETTEDKESGLNLANYQSGTPICIPKDDEPSLLHLGKPVVEGKSPPIQKPKEESSQFGYLHAIPTAGKTTPIPSLTLTEPTSSSSTLTSGPPKESPFLDSFKLDKFVTKDDLDQFLFEMKKMIKSYQETTDKAFVEIKRHLSHLNEESKELKQVVHSKFETVMKKANDVNDLVRFVNDKLAVTKESVDLISKRQKEDLDKKVKEAQDIKAKSIEKVVKPESQTRVVQQSEGSTKSTKVVTQAPTLQVTTKSVLAPAKASPATNVKLGALEILKRRSQNRMSTPISSPVVDKTKASTKQADNDNTTGESTATPRPKTLEELIAALNPDQKAKFERLVATGSHRGISYRQVAGASHIPAKDEVVDMNKN